MSRILATTRMGLHSLTIVYVMSLLETRIGLDPLISVDVKSTEISKMGLHPLISWKCLFAVRFLWKGRFMKLGIMRVNTSSIIPIFKQTKFKLHQYM